MKNRFAHDIVALLSILGAAGLYAGCGTDEAVPFDDSSSSDSSTDTTGATTTAATSGAGGAGGAGATTGTGGGAATTTTSTGEVLPCPGLGDACSDCLAHECSDAYCGCYDNATCGSLLTCLQGCDPTDQSCNEDCLGQNGAGISDALIVGDCSATTCTASCGAGTALTDCEKCLYTSCESQMNTCLADPGCTELVQCVAACNGDSGCQQGCALQNFGAINDAQAVGDCQTASCAVCG